MDNDNTCEWTDGYKAGIRDSQEQIDELKAELAEAKLLLEILKDPFKNAK